MWSYNSLFNKTDIRSWWKGIFQALSCSCRDDFFFLTRTASTLSGKWVLVSINWDQWRLSDHSGSHGRLVRILQPPALATANEVESRSVWVYLRSVHVTKHSCKYVYLCITACVCMCLSRGRWGSTDAPSQWTQWITYRPLSQTQPRRPLVYPALIGPSAELSRPFLAHVTGRSSDRWLMTAGNRLQGFVHAAHAGNETAAGCVG